MTVDKMLLGLAFLCFMSSAVESISIFNFGIRRSTSLPLLPTKGSPRLTDSLVKIIAEIMNLQVKVEKRTLFLQEGFLTENGREKIYNSITEINSIIQSLSDALQKTTISEASLIDSQYKTTRDKAELILDRIEEISKEDRATYDELKEIIKFHVEEGRRVKTQIYELSVRKGRAKEPVVIKNLGTDITKTIERQERLIQQIEEEKNALNERAKFATEYIKRKDFTPLQNDIINLIITLGGIKEGKEESTRNKIKQILIMPLREIKDKIFEAQNEQKAIDTQIELFEKQVALATRDGNQPQATIINNKLAELDNKRSLTEIAIKNQSKKYQAILKRIKEERILKTNLTETIPLLNQKDQELISNSIRNKNEEKAANDEAQPATETPATEPQAEAPAEAPAEERKGVATKAKDAAYDAAVAAKDKAKKAAAAAASGLKSVGSSFSRGANYLFGSSSKDSSGTSDSN